MKPIHFSKKERIYRSEDERISDLPIKFIEYYDGIEALISCWKPDFWDWVKLVFGKPIYLVILGRKHPPVTLSVNALEIGALDKTDIEE